MGGAVLMCLTSCEKKSNVVSTADVNAAIERQQATDTVATSAVDSQTVAPVEEKKAPSPEDKAIGKWEAPSCDADMIYSTTVYELNAGGWGTEIVTDWRFDLDSGKTIKTGTSRSSISWSINGSNVTIGSTHYKLKGKKMYLVYNGSPLYDDDCSTLVKKR